MCLNPLHLRNPTKVVDLQGGQLLNMSVSCGKCAQCLQAKRNEWYVRSFYEVQRTISLGGYVYFDTLTWDEEHIPRLSDFIDIKKYGVKNFRCFNHQHFKLFLKRLRRLISYRYGIKKDAFRYFLTSEYGEDDRYTHRPHYHILFFVYVNIPPLEFSQLVADCWQYGRTDGYPFKPYTYVQKHVYGRAYGNLSFEAISSVCMYVSKYITKNSSYSEKIKKRLMLLNDRCRSEVDLNVLVRSIDMFHRQSQGFGLSYLDNMTPTQLMFLDNCQVYMQDKNEIVKTYPLPMYYKRKLFYTVEKRSDNTRYWQLTDSGVQFNIRTKLKYIDKKVLQYIDIVTNCSDERLINEFYTLLGQRDISDLVVYETFYKGRSRDISAVDFKCLKTDNTLSDIECNLHDWLNVYGNASCPYKSDSSCELFNSKIRVPVVNPDSLNNVEFDYNGHGYLVSGKTFIPVEDYFNNCVFNENSDVLFADFDKILALLVLMTSYQRQKQQQTFDYLENLKQKYKILFNS